MINMSMSAIVKYLLNWKKISLKLQNCVSNRTDQQTDGSKYRVASLRDQQNDKFTIDISLPI